MVPQNIDSEKKSPSDDSDMKVNSPDTLVKESTYWSNPQVGLNNQKLSSVLVMLIFDMQKSVKAEKKLKGSSCFVLVRCCQVLQIITQETTFLSASKTSRQHLYQSWIRLEFQSLDVRLSR